MSEVIRRAHASYLQQSAILSMGVLAAVQTLSTILILFFLSQHDTLNQLKMKARQPLWMPAEVSRTQTLKAVTRDWVRGLGFTVNKEGIRT